jgi:type VI secretion system protein ImpB
MAESLQKWLGRNRPPRVQITYDVELGGAIEKRELPLVVGLLADLSGMPETPLPKLKERRFVEIDRDNFDEVMAKTAPRLELSVPNAITGEGSMPLKLTFKNIDDFTPEPLVNQVPALKRLLDARQQLRDLLAKLDGNDELDKLLEDIVKNTEGLQQLKAATAPAGEGAGA